MTEKDQRESCEKLVIYILLRGSQHFLQGYIIHLVNRGRFTPVERVLSKLLMLCPL